MKKFEKFNLILILITLSLSIQISSAQIPRTISYQGVLTDDTGEIVPDDAYDLTFNLYDAQSDGNLLWTELHEDVTTESGVFSVMLGSNTFLDLTFDQQYFLSIQVNDDDESAQRIPFTSVPYSLRASVAETVINGGSGAFENVDNVVRNSGDNGADDFVFGSPTLNFDGEFAHAARFFLDKSKGAFRAGYDVSNLWDADSLGDKSIALGYNPIAIGQYSTAIGDFSQARGFSALALGSYAKALDDYSTAIGFNSNASGDFSTAIGSRVSSEALYQTSMGHNNTEVQGDPENWVPTDRLFVIGNGSSYYDKSDALVMLKNGNTTLNGQLTLSDGSDSYTLPNTDGAANQTLQTDGEGNVSWQTVSGGSGAFENASGVVRNTGNDETDDFVFGSPTLGYSGEESRFFFDKSKAAFRAGYDEDNDWHPDSLGLHSIALGYRVSALGEKSVALGGFSNSRGYASIAMGSSTSAHGDYSTTAGSHSSAYGKYSAALGLFATARSYGQVSIGCFNTQITGDLENWVTTDRLFVIGNGSYYSPSDALVMLKNGNTTLNGKLTLSDGSDSYTLPNTDGSNGQVLKTDGNGDVYWGTDNSSSGGGEGVFENYNGVVRNTGDDETDDFVFGSPTLDYTWGYGGRFFFDKEKAAFRAGYVSDEDWNDDNIGNYSVAFGYSTRATGSKSVALGYMTYATSDGAIAMGQNSGATGPYSIAFGLQPRASGFCSIAGGYDTRAKGTASLAMGSNTIASGDYSTALGEETTSESYRQTTIGSYNTEVLGDSTNWVSTDRLFVVGNGQHLFDRSDALVMLKNGNTTLNGQLTLSDGSDSYTLPNTDGYGGQILKTDGNGDVYWGTDNTSSGGGEGVFENASGVVRNTGDDASDDFVFGSPTLDYSGEVNRFFFDKDKGAFRAGYGYDGYWDADSVGTYSVAFGVNNKATGRSSVAFGETTSASNFSSTAMGYATQATETATTAMGHSTQATGYIATAMGHSTQATGSNSTAMGYSTQATGTTSTAMGYYTTSSGYYTTAMGVNTTSESRAQTTIGSYNTEVQGNPYSWIGSDRLFVVGNGSESYDRSDALVMLKNGNTTLNGELTLSDGYDSYTLPNTDGGSGQALITDGSGNVSWQTVSGGGGGSAFSMPIITVTDSYTITDADYTVIVNAETSGITVTLPETSTVDTGRIYIIRNIGSMDIDIAASGSDMIINQNDSFSSISLSGLNMGQCGITLQSDGNGNWILISNLGSAY